MAKKHTIVVDADVRAAEREFKKLSSQMKRMGRDIKAFGESMTRLTTPLTAWGAAAVASAMKIQDSFKIIRAGTGATGEALKGLQKDFKALASTVPEGFSESAQAVADFNTMLGATGEPLQKVSRAALDATRLMGGDLSGNVKAFGQVLNAWSRDVAAASDDVNTLFVVSQSTGIGMANLASAMATNSDALQGMGLSFEEAAMVLGRFDQVGIKSRTSMTGLRTALAKMAQEGVKDMATRFKDISEQIKNAGSLSLATSVAVEHFGTTAGPQLAKAIREGRMSLEDLSQVLDQSKGELAQAADEARTFGEKWKMVTNSIALGLEPLGNALISLAERYVMPLVASFAGLAPQINEWIVSFGAIVVAIGPLTWALGNVITIVGAFAKSLWTVKYALTVVGSYLSLMTSASAAVSVLKMAFVDLGAVLMGPAGAIAAVVGFAGFLGYSLFSSAQKAHTETQRLESALADFTEKAHKASTTGLNDLFDENSRKVEELSNKLVDATQKLEAFNEKFARSHGVIGGMGNYVQSLKQQTEATRGLEQAREEGYILAFEKSAKGYEGELKTIVDAARNKSISIAQAQEKFDGFSRMISMNVELKERLGEKIAQTKSQLDYLSVLSPQSSGGSSVGAGNERGKKRTRLDAISDAIRYQGADAVTFIPELDAMLQKLPQLSDEWKKTYEQREQYLSEESRRKLEEQRKAMEAQQKVLSDLSWQNRMGFMGNEEYAGTLQNLFNAQLSAQGNPQIAQWTDSLKESFATLQSAMMDIAGPTMELLKEQFQNGTITSGEYQTALQAIIDKYVEFPMVTEAARVAQEALRQSQETAVASLSTLAQQSWDDMTRRLSSAPAALADAFASAVARGENLRQTIHNLLRDLAAVILRAFIMKTLFGALTGGGVPQFSFPVPSSLGNPTTLGGVFADGAAFSNGIVQPFAQGGIVSRPTVFPMARGAAGLMGEAGPEAIMPLSRGADGKLGVSAEGGGSDVTVHMTVHAVDARSFAQMLATGEGRTTIESIVANNIIRRGSLRAAIQGAV